MNDAIAILADVVQRLESTDIEYIVGGSFASIIYGESRLTRDIDLVLSSPHLKMSQLEEAFRNGYMFDPVGMSRALEERDCYNLIHQALFFQIDVFFPPDTEFSRKQFERKVRIGFDPSDSARQAYFASPEDIVLSKLIWFLKGNKVSSLQWGDAVGVLRVQKENLDNAYLMNWATRLGVDDLLQSAISESVK